MYLAFDLISIGFAPCSVVSIFELLDDRCFVDVSVAFAPVRCQERFCFASTDAFAIKRGPALGLWSLDTLNHCIFRIGMKRMLQFVKHVFKRSDLSDVGLQYRS